jgi:hypothetical protein
MPFSTTIAAVLINLVAQVLPWLGVAVGTDELTAAVQTFIAIGTGIWIWYQRTLHKRVGKAESDVKLSGVKK